MARLLLVLAVALHTFKGQAQDQCQQVFPHSYEYGSDSLQNPSVDDSNCNDSPPVTSCSHPIVITDSSLGPANYDASGSAYYLLNNDETNKILFNFSRPVLLSTIELHYYVNDDGANSVGLPKTRISLVNDFQVTDTFTGRSLTIDPVEPMSGENRRGSSPAELVEEFSATTSQILLRVEDSKQYSLALTEIKFCERRSTPGTPPDTTDSATATTPLPGQSSTTSTPDQTGSTTSSSTTNTADINELQTFTSGASRAPLSRLSTIISFTTLFLLFVSLILR